jgi:hypothetical protein
VPPAVGDRIEFAIAVEVANSNAVNVRIRVRIERRVRRRRESALAVSQQKGEVGRFGIGNQQIEIAIAVEVAGSNIIRTLSAREGRPGRGTKVALAVTAPLADDPALPPTQSNVARATSRIAVIRSGNRTQVFIRRAPAEEPLTLWTPLLSLRHRADLLLLGVRPCADPVSVGGGKPRMPMDQSVRRERHLTLPHLPAHRFQSIDEVHRLLFLTHPV